MAKKEYKRNVYNCIPTPHINAKAGAIAKRCLMPGDPKRAQWIAQTFLTNPKLVSDVRGILAFTGKYKNVPVTIMAHGMGIPSICIYSYELYNFYGVKVIYRIGSCGVDKASKVDVGDVVLATKAWSDTIVERWMGIKSDEKNIFLPTKSCNQLILKTAKAKKIEVAPRAVCCSNFFYATLDAKHKHAITGCHVDEMESWGLFMNAKKLGKKAACLLTVSDNLDTGKGMTALERQTKFKNMARLALESIIKERV